MYVSVNPIFHMMLIVGTVGIGMEYLTHNRPARLHRIATEQAAKKASTTSS